MQFSVLVSRMRQRVASLFPAATSLESRNIGLLYKITLLEGIWGGGTAAFLLVFLARLGASSLTIGAVTAIPAIIVVLLSLPASAYVERQPNHVRTTVRFSFISYVPFAVLPFLPFWSEGPLSILVVILWGLHAIPMSVGSVAWLSVLGSVISSRRRPTVNGARWALSGIFTAVFVALFGQLLDLPQIPFPLNYQVLFFVSAASLFVAMFMARRIEMPPESANAASLAPPARRTIASLLEPIIHHTDFMKYIGATFVLRLGMALPVALYSIFWVRDLQASDGIIGLRTTAGQVALVTGYFLLGRLASRKGHRNILVWSSVGLGLYPIATALSPNSFWLVPAALLWGFSASGINISFFEALFETAPPDKRPSFVAIYTIFGNLANVIGPLLGALLMTYLGIRTTFYIAGALHIIGALLCWWLRVGVKADRV